MKRIVFILILLSTLCFGCGEENRNNDPFQSLEGTRWKLAGIVDTKTGILQVLEPKGKICYTIEFTGDSIFNDHSYFNGDVDVEEGWYSIFTGISVSNQILVWYKVDYNTHSFCIFNIGGSEAAELGDGDFYRELLLSVQSFSLQRNELRLYYNDNKNYLIFKSHTS